MPFRRRIRDRVPVTVAASALVLALVYAADGFIARPASAGAEALLVSEPWHCEVHDPAGTPLVSSAVETFHPSGTLDGVARLEDREAGRLLLEFRYRGVWRFDDPWLTEAIEDYSYLHVDDGAFSARQLAAIEAEFAEPEVSRVHALTRAQLVYGAHESIYQCYRRPASDTAGAVAPPPGATG